MDKKELELKYMNLQATNEYLLKKINKLQSYNKFGYMVGSVVDKAVHVKDRGMERIRNRKIKKMVLNFNKDGFNTIEKREKKIIVSLTSYAERLKYVPAVIGSMLRQTVKPDRIVLWLGKEDARNKDLPKIFTTLMDYGLEIRYRPDIRAHTKWYYAFKEFPNDLIITVDDDIIYESTVIEKLYKTYIKYPNMVPALRVHRIRFEDNATLKNYNDWDWEYSAPKGTASHQFFATGVGGVLYNPEIMNPEICNLDYIKKYCPTQDDFWMKVMEVLSGARVVLADNKSKTNGVTISGSQRTAMWRINVKRGGNDKQIQTVLPVYNNWFGNGKLLTEIMALDKISKGN